MVSRYDKFERFFFGRFLKTDVATLLTYDNLPVTL